MNEPQTAETQTKSFTFFKYSFWDIAKIVTGTFLLAQLFHLLAAADMSFTHMLNKAVGISSDFAEFCAYCLDKLSG